MARSPWPWDLEKVNPKYKVVYNLRIPQPYFLKLKVLVKHLGYKSMQELCWECIQEWIDEELDEGIFKAKVKKEKLQETIDDMELDF
jgi:hypothetical protein